MNSSAKDLISDGGDEAVQGRTDAPNRNSFGPRPTKFGRSYGKGPRQHNGIHRRRKKKVRW